MNLAATPRVLLHVFPTFELGGSQIRFATLANRLAGRYRHLIVAIDNCYGAVSLLGPHVEYAFLKYELDKRRTLANLGPCRKIIRDCGANKLLTYNWGATEWGLANLLGGVPHVHIEDGFGPEEVDRQLPRRIWFRRLALARARPIVVPSRTLYRIAREVWRFPAHRIAYIPNGVDCARFACDPDPALCAQLGLDGRQPVVGTVAALRPEKNIGRLLRAFAQAGPAFNARLVIVGSGAEAASLRELVQALGIQDRVAFAGRIDGVERILRAFDVYAISSDTEQMPISLVEAMAAGLPVASVDVGDIAIMVAPENRPYVQGRDDGVLAASLRTLLADRDLCARLGAANAARARREYEETTMVAAYDAIYAGRREVAPPR
jgi:glycosyltransferase involved in cell wall biosynthesis